MVLLIMAQPIRKRKQISVKPKMDGLEYCNECPFLGYDFEKDVYMCNPNDWVFGKTNDKISVPLWCGNRKQK